MKKQITEHVASIVFIAFLFGGLIILLNQNDKNSSKDKIPELPVQFQIRDFDYENPLQRALLTETLNIFYDSAVADSILQMYQQESGNDLSNTNQSSGSELDIQNIFHIILMYVKFLLIYIVVLGLTYYGVQTLAVFRFVSKKQNKPNLLMRSLNYFKKVKKKNSLSINIQNIIQALTNFLKAILKTILYLLLFSPAYVIAYSFKTKFDTDSIIFMIILGVISNALLITYAQKFYTFLVSENNKGYVETAIVKNLKNEYDFVSIQLSSILNLKKIFNGHVFNHIFINAQHQYYSTIKEQAAFLITGLIIIEMALNIHGHLSYELMQNLLYQKYQLVIIILFLIYLTVKFTEMLVDLFIFKQNKKYQNV